MNTPGRLSLPVLLMLLLCEGSCACEVPPAVADALEASTRLCRSDQGSLWGTSLCGPTLVADFENQRLWASRADAEGALRAMGDLYSAPLPENHPRANTSLEWSGLRWTQLVAPLPGDARERHRLVMHESFHRIQPQLGLASAEAPLPHLDELRGRLLQRLEWRALRQALSSTGPLRLAAVHDAVRFLEQRQALAAGIRASEWRLFANEGLAEYTGVRLAYGPEADSWAADRLAQADRWQALPRRFAYASGPAWGLLLDEYLPGWRRRVLEGEDLRSLLAGLPEPKRTASSSDPDYDRDGLEREERRLAEKRAAERRRITEALLAEDSLVLPLRAMELQMNPDTVSRLPDQGNVHRELVVTDQWGRVEVDGIALINDQWTELRLPPVAAESPTGASGPGYRLQLEPGWSVTGNRVQRTAAGGSKDRG